MNLHDIDYWLGGAGIGYEYLIIDQLNTIYFTGWLMQIPTTRVITGIFIYTGFVWGLIGVLFESCLKNKSV